MTVRRFTYTGREAISKERLVFEVLENGEDSARTFTAKFNFADMKFPDKAEVIVEATCGGTSTVNRYSFGTVEDISSPADLRLTRLSGKRIMFTVKVVDHTEQFGCILGICKDANRGKQGETESQGLLPVELSSELGELLWKLEFEETEVFLLVNEESPEIKERLERDPSFHALIWPEVIRRVLERAFEKEEDAEEEEGWPRDWLVGFGQELHPEKEDPLGLLGDDNDEMQKEWIDAVVYEFCRKHTLKQRYQSSVQTEQ